MPRSTRARMSRSAVSCEHFASFAYFDVVSLPSKPSSRRLRTKTLALVERDAADALPEARLGEDRARALSARRRWRDRGSQKPFHPRRDVQRALLRALKDVVVRRPLLPDLRRHAVEALGLSSERASAMSAIARAMRPLPSSNGWIVTNQRCASPAFRQRHRCRAGLLNQSGSGAISCVDAHGWRRLEVHPFPADRPGDDLHRTGAVVAPSRRL